MKVQSFILTTAVLITGFHLLVIGLVTNLIAANRRLREEALLRMKKDRPVVKRNFVTEQEPTYVR